jgi:hypothetical protein
MKRLLIVLSLFVATTASAIIFPEAIDQASLGSIATITLAISAMIFTIMGVWIAFIYPNAILRIKSSKLKNTDFTENQIEKKRLSLIVGAILLSLLASTGILAIELCKAFRLQELLPFFSPITAHLTVSFAIIQIISVADVALANINFLNDLHTKSDTRRAEQQL